MPLEKVRKVLKIAKEPISLETPIGDEEDSHLGDFIEDKNAVQPLDAAIQANLRETTTRVLAILTPREERVLRMRFGIGMNTDHTLEEVGQQFSVTRERIRQIEAKALRKLKHPIPVAANCGASWTTDLLVTTEFGKGDAGASPFFVSTCDCQAAFSIEARDIRQSVGYLFPVRIRADTVGL